MKKEPKLKPTAADALVALAVLLLALVFGARFYLAPAPSGTLTVVVTVDGAERDRFALGETARSYRNNGYTVRVAADGNGVRVESADCPTQDCVRTGTITRAGQSIVCLPSRIVVTLEDAAGALFDAVAG